MYNLDILYETLSCMGGKKKDASVSFLSDDLVIKCKESGIKYTITKVGINKKNKKPVVKAYRYYGPSSNKKYFITIYSDNFNKYVPV